MLQRLAVLAVVCALWGATPGRGHGRLLEPPSRASAWRFGFPTPHNYNDHEVYCGGVARQWRKNGGNCGVCGDAWDQKTPRPHELGGRFGQGLIVRRYAPGATFSARVDLTVDHGGFWELRLCPSVENTTQECLDRHLLHTEDGAERFYPKDGNKVYETNYTLPTGLTCERCVIQWRYIAANSWGSCPNGTGAIGCGHQEEFRACADVAILPPPRTRPSYVAPTRRVTTTTTEHTTTEVTFSEPDNDIAEDIKDSTQDDLSQAAPAGALAAGVTLCVVLACFSLVYLVYYRGDRIKKLLKMSGRAPPEPAEATAAPPERPPRHKKPQDSHRLESDNSSEPGFENIRLHENMI